MAVLTEPRRFLFSPAAHIENDSCADEEVWANCSAQNRPAPVCEPKLSYLLVEITSENLVKWTLGYAKDKESKFSSIAAAASIYA
jgi:hypothetical protein